MGGKGSGSSRVDSSAIKSKLDLASKESDEQAYNVRVNELIQSLLTDINQRGSSVDVHIAEIEKKLKEDIDEFISLQFGGSVSKHTYVDGLSDVDMLMVINDSSLTDKGPDAVNKHVLDVLKSRFPTRDIVQGKLAITVRFQDVEIQILPAIKRATGFKIADATGKNWSDVIKPDKFREKLSKVNADMNKKLIPMIKVVKNMISNLPENVKPTGYHIEALAIEAFENYKGKATIKDMITHFYKDAPKYISSPIPDKTNQSVYVDEYCGRLDSKVRVEMATHFDRISRSLQNADKTCSDSVWDDLLK